MTQYNTEVLRRIDRGSNNRFSEKGHVHCGIKRIFSMTKRVRKEESTENLSAIASFY